MQTAMLQVAFQCTRAPEAINRKSIRRASKHHGAGGDATRTNEPMRKEYVNRARPLIVIRDLQWDKLCELACACIV
jgi:hypothetical protein